MGSCLGKCSDGFKDEVVRLAEELVGLEECSLWAAAEELGEKRGVLADMLNDWLKLRTPVSDA